MDWINNASVIASLVLSFFGIGGYLYGITTYLRKRGNPPKQNAESSLDSRPQKSISSRPLSWLEWIELFARGLVDTADFILNLLPIEDDMAKYPDINKIGFCALICGVGIFFGEIIIGFAMGFFLSVMGVSNSSGAAVGITTILLFMTFSLVYIYHVGILAEKKQQELDSEIKGQQSVMH